MDVQADKEAQQQILQFMTTEHFTLQTARSATIAEANGRCALFMGSVSSAVVAVAFIGQASKGSSCSLLSCSRPCSLLASSLSSECYRRRLKT